MPNPEAIKLCLTLTPTFLRNPINCWLCSSSSCSYRKIMCNLDIIKRRLCNALEQTGAGPLAARLPCCCGTVAGILPLGCGV